MTPRQWVAHAGLDPRAHDSGTSLHKPARISKKGNSHLRAALYMPAMVAAREEPSVRSFYQKRIAGGLKPIQTLVAVERKLLHSIHGMWSSNRDFDGEKFCAMSA
jgi:transposase